MIRSTLISFLVAVTLLSTAAPSRAADNMFSLVLTVTGWIVRNYVPVYEIQVQAYGRTEQEARQQAFRIAVERAVGSLTVSETENRLSADLEHVVLSYSSGYVHEFEIVSKKVVDNGVQLVVTVWVERSGIADRLLDRTTGDSEIPGTVIDQRYQTLLHERNQGDRLIANILRDYPKRTFHVDVGNIDTRLDFDRNLTITTNVEISMSSAYLFALSQILRDTAQAQDIAGCFRRNNRCGYSHLVRTRYHTGGLFEKREFLGYDDRVKSQILGNAFQSVNPSLQVNVLDQQGILIWRECFVHPALSQTEYQPERRFVHWDNTRTLIDGTLKVDTELKTVVPQNKIDRVSRLEVVVVPLSECYN